MVTLIRKERSFLGRLRSDGKHEIGYYEDERELPQSVLAKLGRGRREMGEVLSQVKEADVSKLKPLLVGLLSDVSVAILDSMSGSISTTYFELPPEVKVTESDGEICRITTVGPRRVHVQVKDRYAHDEIQSTIINATYTEPDKFEMSVIKRTHPTRVDYYACLKTKGRITCNKSTTEGSWHQLADELQTD